MKHILKFIDSISEMTGRTARWLAAGLVLVMCYDVFMRYFFNAPTMWAYETAMMTGGVMASLGWSYVHRHNAHIKVDILYAQYPTRVKAVMDVIGAMVFFLPWILALMYSSTIWMVKSWVIGEKMTETFWYPPAAPLRTFIFVGMYLFFFQGMANFIRDLHMVIRGRRYD